MVGAPVGFFGSCVSRSAGEPPRTGTVVLMICRERERGSTEYVLPGEVSSLKNGGGDPGWSTASTLSPVARPAEAKPRPPKSQGVKPQIGPAERRKSPEVQPPEQIARLPSEGDPGASENRKSAVRALNEKPSRLSSGARPISAALKKT